MLVLRASVRRVYIFAYSDRKKKLSKIKAFFTDSQPGCVLSMFLKFWSISLNFLMKKVLIKTEKSVFTNALNVVVLFLFKRQKRCICTRIFGWHIKIGERHIRIFVVPSLYLIDVLVFFPIIFLYWLVRVCVAVGTSAWHLGIYRSLGTVARHLRETKNKTCILNTRFINRFVNEGNNKKYNLIISLKRGERPFGVLIKVSYGDDKPWVQIRLESIVPA